MPRSPVDRRLVILLLAFIDAHAPAMGEQYDTGWQLNIDNDIFADTDRDYTGGLAITLSGERARESLFSLERARSWFDRQTGLSEQLSMQPNIRLHSLQYGFMLFTPKDITSAAPVFDDRPYGSLFFLSSTELTVLPAADMAYMSTLTVGLLGLHAAEEVQNALHDLTDSDRASGWDNQISSGGEPTLMYTLSMQHRLSHATYTPGHHELKAAYEANIGFSTDINTSLIWRWGRFDIPWWSFNPQHSEYILLGSPTMTGGNQNKTNDLFLWAGATLKYRFYSSLLQGQFRESMVKFSSDQVEKLLAELWIGATWEFAENIDASIYYRASSEEFKGPNAHKPIWGGITIRRAY